MTQWAEIRHQHQVDGVPKKELARRFQIDVKTVRRALQQAAPPKRRPTKRSSRMDPFRERIEALLRTDPDLTNKRVGVLLLQQGCDVRERQRNGYIARVRRDLFPKEVFVHRTHLPGKTMEGDFGQSVAKIAGKVTRVFYFVAALPACNAYAAKAYPVERLECLLDGINHAFECFRGLTDRIVLDNTSLAVRRVLRGTDREETDGFQAFRGSFPIGVDYCAPAKGWEKGSVEGGVEFVRQNCFLPMPDVPSFAALNELIRSELAADTARRRLPDGRTVAEALTAEREHLRPLPAVMPEPCRTTTRVVDKFAQIVIDGVRYQAPIECAYKPVVVKLFADRVAIVADGEIVTDSQRSFDRGALVLDPHHVLDLLARKSRAVPEATALLQWPLPPVFESLHRALCEATRKGHQEYVLVLRLIREHGEDRVAEAAQEALRSGSPRFETIRLCLQRRSHERVPPTRIEDSRLASIEVAAPRLDVYDQITEAAR
jgi:transposase